MKDEDIEKMMNTIKNLQEFQKEFIRICEEAEAKNPPKQQNSKK